jgi:predicted SprT family Zn-dependent metalloprotease
MPSANRILPDLNQLFREINQNHFEGFLDPISLQWNSRLRSCAGRFFPGSRKYFRTHPPRIEVALYLTEEENSLALIADTIAHEMIHYWLWARRKPYGHTAEFLSKMREMGVSRYNPVPRIRPYKYLYQCLSCKKDFPSRKRLGTLACAECCKKHSQGKYDARFKLVLNLSAQSSEVTQATHQSLG